MSPPSYTPFLHFLTDIHTHMAVYELTDLITCFVTVLDTLTVVLYTPILYVVSHHASLPLLVGQVLHAFSTRVWLVLVCQKHLDGPRQRFSCTGLIMLY